MAEVKTVVVSVIASVVVLSIASVVAVLVVFLEPGITPQPGSRESQTVTATVIGSFDHKQSHFGITKIADRIYVLDRDPNRIKVYEDMTGFHFVTDIALNSTKWPYDIAYSSKSKCVYISDYDERCIWEMTTTGEHRLTKWLKNINRPYTLSLSNEGHLLVLRGDRSPSQLEIYSLNATLIRRLQLPNDIKNPQHVVQTSTGNFIICHRLNDASTGPWVISQLTTDAQLINRFIPRNKSEELNEPYYVSLESEKNRLFVADYYNHRVISFDSSALTWSKVLVSRIAFPFRLYYDASKKHLFVADMLYNVTVYDIK